LNYADLAHQIALQKKHAWDLDEDIPWHLGIDATKFFLPLDDQSIAFPGASAEQQLALSQFMGLVVNATISEMEDALPKLKYSGWQRLLDEYPVGPEIVELGEMFFEEEAKHARAFGKFLDIFCNALNVEREELDSLLPKAYGSNFQRAITQNAYHGGHAFWWVVASVEEVSISIYHQIFRHRQHIDPLYFQLHRRHLEEESRHANYAFLMLNLISQKPTDIRTAIHRKVDFIISQLVGAPWVITELYKFFNVKELRHRHPFFEVLASCVPLYEKMSKPELIKRMFLAAPYISWLLNPKWRKLHLAVAKNHGAIVPPFPQPISPTLSTIADS
jgi:hypothetical protein